MPDTNIGVFADGAASQMIPIAAIVFGSAGRTFEPAIASFETRPAGAPQDEGRVSVLVNKTFILRSRGREATASRRMR